MQSLNKRKCIIRIFAIINVLCLLITFVGCGSGDANNNTYKSISGGVAPSGVLAQNSNYELLWDSDAKAVVMKSLKTGNVWSDIIYEAFQNGQSSANVMSPIYVTVVNNRTLQWNTFRSSIEIPKSGSVVSRKIDNGIRVTYFFDTYQIAIPVEYTLRNDSLLISINTQQILESGEEFKLLSVGVGQNICSIKNEAENGQLFIPVGDGALMNTAVSPNGERSFAGEVYGDDAARQKEENYSDDTNVKFPVFGASGGGKGVLAIIEEGAAAAEIEAESGNERLGYSKVGATFYVRGYDEFRFSRKTGAKKSLTTRIGEDLARNKLSVAFYPLEEGAVDYIGMANRYKKYLTDKKLLEKNTSESAYAVTLVGGTQVSKSFLGVPYNEAVALTTFAQAKEILTDLEKEIGNIPETRLYGFSDNGIRAGKVAGGKNYLSVYGTKKDIKSLIELFKDKSSKLFFDSEIVKFSKSGLGFSMRSDVAQTAVKKAISHTTVNPVRINKSTETYSILSRSELENAVDIVINKAEKYGYNGISLSSLGGMAYSDYSEDDGRYSSKYNMEKDVAALIKTVKDSKYNVAVASANEYAALAADIIFEAPLNNGSYNAFDTSVPFYQLVFHSYKPMYSEAVNLQSISNEAFAKSVAYGMGLGYTLISEYEPDSNDLDVYQLYGMVYKDNKELIKDTVVNSGYDKLYKEIKDAEMLSYSKTDSVSKTEYSNGKIVYVNHSSKPAESPVGQIPAYGFIVG